MLYSSRTLVSVLRGCFNGEAEGVDDLAPNTVTLHTGGGCTLIAVIREESPCRTPSIMPLFTTFMEFRSMASANGRIISIAAVQNV
jgi:hypothetical protein